MKKTLRFIALIGLTAGFLMISNLCYGATLFEDNFNTYNHDSDLNGQGSWDCSPATAYVENDEVYEGAYAVKNHYDNSCWKWGTSQTDGQITIFYMTPDVASGIEFYLYESGVYKESIRVNTVVQGDVGYYNSGWQTLADNPIGVWNFIVVEWRTSDDKFQITLNDTYSSGWVSEGASWSAIDSLRILNGGGNYPPYGGTSYFDTIQETPEIPSIISVVSPANHSTITDLETNLVVDWSNINHEIYPYIWLSFIDTKIYEHSEIYSFLITEDSGEIEIPLTEFEFSKNGQWDLRAMAEYDASTFLSLDPVPIYYLILDVEGLPEPYYFTDFDDWYSANVEDYEAPSEWASAMVGYLEPIFEKIGEFGNRVNAYLDTSLAYERGFDIGNVFPVIIAYVGKIDMFFGGFPIVAFFKWLIFIMIGLFAVKVILKLLSFIPFFGGGG